MRISAIFVIGALLASVATAPALTTSAYVSGEVEPSSFCLFKGGSSAGILASTNDWPGVLRAAGDLQTDIRRVSGLDAKVVNDPQTAGTNVIIVGTLGKSAVIDQLVREGKIDASGVAGQRESFLAQVVPQPLPGIENALVVCGSDKRGTIYGIYDLSEQMGVSPWHFFADVPPQHHDELYVKAGKYVQGPPAVKYRGIFINDEAPDLTGWVKEHYGDYNHGFYTNVFELLLRLKANYLWPAMWNNCFNEDDPLNYQLADEYGIVMGTSHVEPMMRADKEWNRLGFTARDWNFQTHSNELLQFWRDGLERNKNCENIITIAMRGKIDTPMSETANISLLEEIVSAQRNIIADVYHTNAPAVPQLWALYKEVQEYFEKGMRVPDDVTLLWCDDNWGDLRRLPSPGDRHRSGGSGIYYHFDYVGGPRNYKWVNSTSLPRVWEQMNLAHQYDANQIWIVNVGHLQHVQLPMDFFLSLAWNPEQWPKQSISKFIELWAERQFGVDCAPEVADIISTFTRFNARPKPELLAPDTFSVVNYQEADRVVSDWQALVSRAEAVSEKLPQERRDAFYELVLYPVTASANLNALYVAAAKNHLYAAQGRASANDWAAEVKLRFRRDAELSRFYNEKVANGKWNHMMDQTHIGYTSWQQPNENIMPRVTTVDPLDTSKIGVAIEGSTNSWPDFQGEATLPLFDSLNRQRRYIEIFNPGTKPVAFSASATVPWLLLDTNRGVAEKDQKLWVSVDWEKVPAGQASGDINITSGTNAVVIKAGVFNPQMPDLKSFHGFIEGDGYVSMEAAHFTAKLDIDVARWQEIDGLGNTLSAMSTYPVTAPSVTPPQNSSFLEYTMYLFHTGPVKVECRIAPTLNFMAGHGLRFGLSLDDAPPQVITAVPEEYTAGDANHEWQETVSDNLRKVIVPLEIKTAGRHVLKFWMVDPGVVLEKIIVDCGGVRPSYLGPPESFRQ